ncbi:MAG: hypothetical protein IJU47_02480, partial [Verrucomicrobia bacterium]|nr:hypothetical protein [Verrucomicrobiota bacterium]
DLQISLQGTNVVLSWASTNSDYYLVQYSTNLHSSHPWQTLTNWMPGSDGTNTVFVHSGAFHVPAVSPDSLGYNDLLSAQTLNQEEVPLAMRANDPDSAAPVFLYPPGFDFSGFLLYDPVTQTWRSGNGFTRDNSPDPLNPGTNTNSTVTMPVMYFYRVGRNGVYLSGLTNGTTLSGTVSIPLDVVGVEGETVTGVSLFDNGSLIKVVNITSNSIPDHVDLDTRELTNGIHNITAWIEVRPHAENQTNFVQLSSESSPVSVNSYNSISYPRWQNHFGDYFDGIQINLQTVYTNLYYQVDFAGSHGTNVGSYISSQLPVNGVINDSWGLTTHYSSGEMSYANEPYFDITVSFLAADDELLSRGVNIPSDNNLSEDNNLIEISPNMCVFANENARKNRSTTRSVVDSIDMRKYRMYSPWVTSGSWVFAHHDLACYHPENDNLKSAIDEFKTYVEYSHIVMPAGNGTNITFRLPSSFDVDSNQTYISNCWQQLREALSETNSTENPRNFFYFGHGSASSICDDGGWLNVPLHQITSNDIFNDLRTNENESHSYRFVFLFACNTANGDLGEAFGIPKDNLEEMDFFLNGSRPRSFVGMSREYTLTENINDKYVVDTETCDFIRYFSQYWTSNFWSLREALEKARDDSRLDANRFDLIKIQGYQDLFFHVHNGTSIGH